MTLSFENLDAANRAHAAKVGTGTVREPWPRRETFWRWVVGTIAAGIALAVMAWWLA